MRALLFFLSIGTPHEKDLSGFLLEKWGGGLVFRAELRREEVGKYLYT